MTTGGTSYGYSYDGDGRRVSSDTRNGCNGTPQASAITRYAWDELSAYGDVVAELNSSNTTATMQYIVGDGTVLAQQAGTSAPARFLLHDGQGSTRSLFDNGGTLLENYVYDAFGTLKAPTTGTPQTRYLYTGQQFDAATKLYSLRARYYNPTQGRFTARDTAAYNNKYPVELNRYGYVANNPTNWVDPTGYGELSEIAFIEAGEDLETNTTALAQLGKTTSQLSAGPSLALQIVKIYSALATLGTDALYHFVFAMTIVTTTEGAQYVIAMNANIGQSLDYNAQVVTSILDVINSVAQDAVIINLSDPGLITPGEHAERIVQNWAKKYGYDINIMATSNYKGACAGCQRSGVGREFPIFSIKENFEWVLKFLENYGFGS